MRAGAATFSLRLQGLGVMPNGTGNGQGTGTTKPVIFISYSHKDEPDHPRDGEVKWRSFVTDYLQPAVKFGIVDIWVDQQLQGGDDLDPEIERKLYACDIFILLVSVHSMASNYIVDKEIAITRERQSKGEEVHFYPLLLTPTPKVALSTLKDKVIRPKDAKPLSSFPLNERIEIMTGIADEIGDIAGQIAQRKKATVVSTPQIRMGAIKTELGNVQVITSTAPVEPESALFVTIDIVHLPETPYERLVGRDEELKRLDEAWESPTINVFSLVAEGGAGKSALVNEWLARMQAESFRGAEAVLGWSFYSQGSKERATSADAFLNWTLEKLGIKLDTTSANAKGEAIAEALAKRRVLLLLDGVEPLQHGPGPQVGQLKDLGLRALLRRFAATPAGDPHGLIVITSRLAVADLARWKDTAAPVLDVEKLSDEAGAALLRDNGVWGTDKELRAAAHDFAGHPLALGLLASFLKETQFGDVRRRDHIRAFFADADNPRHDHAKRVMESYEKEWLADHPVLLAIMHMVGLFDQPATADCLKALRKKPAIAGLTDTIVGLSDDEWNRAAARLREVRLLSPQDHGPVKAEKPPFIPAKAGIQSDRSGLGPRLRGDERSSVAPDSLDAHPLVREWFGESLRKKSETAWRAAHGRLYDHLRRTTKEGDKPTLEDLAPLYQAIAHGCRAGRHQEALDEVYKNRICRRALDGELKFYSEREFGAFGSNLAALTYFFDKAYDTPAAVLRKASRAWVISEAGRSLMAQGRFAEALPGLRAGLRMFEAAENWRNAAIGAINLSQTELIIGEVDSAISTAERAVAHADRSGNTSQMMINRTTQADALHAAGRQGEAEVLFAEAERRQGERQPAFPLLYSLRGYQYCDLLLAKGDWAAARDRAAQTREWVRPQNWLLDIAVDTLTLGRAHLGLALAAAGEQAVPPAEGQGDARIARIRLDEAVDGLRAAGAAEFVTRGLLARAAFRRSIGDWKAAARDLDEVEEIAEPGPMKLHLCDMAIERARLAFAQIEAFAPLNGLLENNNPPKPAPPSADKIARLKKEAAEQLQIAADYISSCGYHKRDEELAELQEVLRGERKFADLPPRV
jgi:tetratricopeptide (TPR) repeat protein